jgi:hypothetical protein
MVFSTAGFARVFPEKRLELKSLKRQTKAEEEGTRGPFLLSLRLPLKALLFEPFLRKNSRKTFSRKHHTILKNRMAVLRNRRPPRMPPGCADPLLKKDYQYSTVELTGTELAHQTRAADVRGIS